MEVPWVNYHWKLWKGTSINLFPDSMTKEIDRIATNTSGHISRKEILSLSSLNT